MTPVSRRHILAGVTLAPLVPLVGRPDAAAAAPARPAIRPRAEWAGERRPTGPLQAEDEPRFLLIHHTVTSNAYAADEVPRELRSILAFHTGAERGWPDVAYNFFVDRFGTIWEGREGSLAGPVRGDASGGSQGFAQLCCFLGDFDAAPPTPEARAAMASLLAWLAGRDGIDLASPVNFTSRGSNRWRRGVEVTTDPIAGHRDMSLTGCPGDALYPLVRSELAPAARSLLSDAGRPASPAPSVTASSVTASASPSATSTPGASEPPPAAGEPVTEAPNNDARALWVGAGMAGMAAAAFGIRGWGARRRRAAAESTPSRTSGATSGAQEPHRQGETAAQERSHQTDEESAQGQ